MEKSIRSKHPREETGNGAFNLQLNPRSLKERGFFFEKLRFKPAGSAHPPDF